MSSSSAALRKAVVLCAGGGVFASSVYLSYHLQRMEQAYQQKRQTESLPSNFSFVADPCRNEQYQHVASCYDDAIGSDEFYMGIGLLRRALLYFHARGTVLEVGAGTARNLKYYPAAVQRVVLVDASDRMLEQAKQKVNTISSSSSPTSINSKQFAFVLGDSAKLDLPGQAFDTVVDTFGLCSYDDPVAVLKEMARVCKPSGKILLLEHGRSKNWDFVTRHIDKHAEQHAANWGCVWNRDLDAVLAEAAGGTGDGDDDSVVVETLRKFHFGTTYYVVARPKHRIQ